jgi:hypothetical protein
MSRIQLTKTFKMVQHFKTALEECHDVTEYDFPKLLKANVNKLTKKSQKKIMIFVVRLHFAMHVLNILEKGKKWKLDFFTFPELQKVMLELELDLKMVEKLDENKPSPNAPIMTDDGISSRITAIKMELASIVEARQDMVKELEEMRQSLDRVTTNLDNFSTYIELVIVKNRATMLEGLLKKDSKEETDSD